MPRTAKTDRNVQIGPPPRPATLSDTAAKEWDKLAQELADAGIQTTPAHRSVMELAANIAADMAEASIAIEKDGAYVAGKMGIVAHPATKRLDALRRDRIKVLTMLGIRVAAASPDTDKEDSLDDALGAR